MPADNDPPPRSCAGPSGGRKARRLALVLSTILAVVACGRGKPQLGLAAGDLAIEQDVAGQLVEVLATEPAVAIHRVAGPLSGEAALDAIESGDAGLALVTNNLPFRSSIVTIVPVYASVLHIAYRRDRPATDGRTLLSGARVYAGPEGSAARTMLARVTPRLGLASDSYRFVEGPDDAPDVLVVFAPVLPDRIDRLGDYALFSLGEPDDIGRGSVVDAVSLAFPQFRPAVIPRGIYGDKTPEPVVTLAVDTVLVASRELDRPVAYRLVRALLEKKPLLAADRQALFAALSGDFDPEAMTFPVHPGVLDYQQRDEPSVYERYAGIAEVVIAGTVALVTAAFATARLVRYRRKNRIDVYYLKILEIRRAVEDEPSGEECRRLLRQIRAIENDAFRMLVDEKLSADESFRIFVTLAQDVRRELLTIAEGGPSRQ